MSTKRRKVKATATVAGGDGIEPIRNDWLLPRTAEAYDAMVEQMAKSEFEWRAFGWKWAKHDPQNCETWRKQVRASLRAIGITRPKEDKQ